jgi:hypothetical protein
MSQHEENDWVPLYDVVDHVVRTQHCYRERAIELVRTALDNFDAKSRTVDRPPRLVRSFIGGSEVFSEPPGEIIEVWREDVFRLWPDVADAQSLPPVPQKSSKHPKPLGAKLAAIFLAIKTLWPDGVPVGLTTTDRNNRILDFLRADPGSLDS